MGEGERTKDRYLDLIERHERRLEKSIIETLGRVEINAMTKSDRFSLPYKNEIVVPLYGESYVNGPYEFHRVARRIVKELLEKNLYKIRFYIYIEIDTGSGSLIGGSLIKYHFRYHIPHQK